MVGARTQTGDLRAFDAEPGPHELERRGQIADGARGVDLILRCPVLRRAVADPRDIVAQHEPSPPREPTGKLHVHPATADVMERSRVEQDQRPGRTLADRCRHDPEQRAGRIQEVGAFLDLVRHPDRSRRHHRLKIGAALRLPGKLGHQPLAKRDHHYPGDLRRMRIEHHLDKSREHPMLDLRPERRQPAAPRLVGGPVIAVHHETGGRRLRKREQIHRADRLTGLGVEEKTGALGHALGKGELDRGFRTPHGGLQRPQLAQPRFARHDRRDHRESGNVFAPDRREGRKGRTQPDTQETRLGNPGTTAQFIDRVVNAPPPRLPSRGIQVLARRVAGAVVVEPERRVAGLGRRLGEVP